MDTDTGALINYTMPVMEPWSYMSSPKASIVMSQKNGSEKDWKNLPKQAYVKATGILSGISSSLFTPCSKYIDAGLKENRKAPLEFNNFDTFAILWMVFISILGVIITVIGLRWIVKNRCGSTTRMSKSSKEKRTETQCITKLKKLMKKFKLCIYGVILIILTSIFGLVLIFCFVTNEEIKSTDERVENAMLLNGTRKYLDFTRSQMEFLFSHNFDELSLQIERSLNRSDEVLKNKLVEKHVSQSLKNFTDTVNIMKKSWIALKDVNKTLQDLKNLAGVLQSNITVASQIINSKLKDCKSVLCSDFLNSPLFKNLKVENNFSQLKSISHDLLVDEWSQFSTGKFQNAISFNESANEMSGDLFGQIIAHVNTPAYIQHVNATLKNAHQTLQKISYKLGDALESVISPSKRTQKNLMDTLDTINFSSRHTTGLMICIPLIFIVILLYAGAILGIFGVQPKSDNSNDLFSKSNAALFLKTGMFLIILAFLGLSMLPCYFFFQDGFGTKAVCASLDSLDKGTPNEYGNYTLPLYTAILRSSKNDQSAFSAFHLTTVFNDTQIHLLLSDFKEKTQNLSSSANPFSEKKIPMLKKETIETMKNFSHILNGINFELLYTELSKNIVPVNLLEVAQKLDAILDKESSLSEKDSDKLRATSEYLKIFNEDLDNLFKKVNICKRSLEQQEKYRAVYTQGLENLQDFLQQPEVDFSVSELKNDAKRAVSEFTGDLIRQVDHYVNFTYNKVINEMGKCHPLYNSFESALLTVCENSILPIRGFWLDVSILLVLFVPILYFASIFSTMCNEKKNESTGETDSINTRSSLIDTERHDNQALSPNDTEMRELA